jgi:hypothetical protein
MISLDSGPWISPTMPQVREVILSRAGVMTSPDVREPARRIDRALGQWVADISRMVLRSGRVFDLGFMPNEVVKSQSLRGGPLWAKGHIRHPFLKLPYALFHRWEGGGSFYLIYPEMPAKLRAEQPDNACMVVEMRTMTATDINYETTPVKDLYAGKRLLLTAGISVIWPDPNDPMVHNSNLLYCAFEPEEVLDATGPQCGMASLVQSMVDPMVAGLMFLNTDGVAIDRVDVSAKLNKARTKSGKEPIPGYWRANTGPYITALTRHLGPRGPAQGGHHASPQPHLRRGHLRHKHERHGGGEVWVRDALVLIKDGKELDGQLNRRWYERTD